ncbi:MAG: hypothetical protein P1U89_20790 [Verrucomicrobiales bacterium]|nr:hypothetical protein [Verrucomicrobiales bacterium]
MKTQSGAKITFTKSDLASFSEGETKVLYVFSHILNRLKLLDAQVFSHWRSAQNPERSQIEQQAAMLGVLESLLLLAGELKEGWEAVQQCYYSTQLSKTLNSQLPEDIQKLLKRLPDRFSGSGVITRLRNDFSYHHSPDMILATSKLLDDDDPHVAYLFEGDNNYFDFATKMRIASIAEALGLDDWRTTIDKLVQEVVRNVYTPFSHVLNAILVKLFEKIDHEHEEVEIPAMLEAGELDAHYFFYVDPKA